ncbi:MAG: UDP-N-acetylglucosamine--N-acetylmuramyl-(pentapeptide) pyrophosphoryl-undecaprenol N-acetylglucosamine transferase, partial [Armatimonadetes bacterium]|nr:UDP-N-acetylglucosamine--N-acetylmuramyl-(pentapeptide) pyrophosphoryl-undecaprenol N-acetylglucosamine transferase [Armatimonadota bacterium]
MKWVLAGGGTGGHLFPALAIAEVAKQRFPDLALLFVASWRGLERSHLEQTPYEWIGIPSRSFPRHIVAPGTIGSLSVLVQGIGRLLLRFRSFRPQLIIGTGGYVSVPALIAGRLYRSKIVFLEANTIPGRTHRLLSRLADRVVTGFPEAVSFFREGVGTYTGLPVRKEFLQVCRSESRKHLQISKEDSLILVMGGSQGARRINEAIFDALGRGLLENPSWHLIHLCGSRWEAEAQSVRRALPERIQKRYRVYGFFGAVASFFHSADLLISRAGASTIAEALCAGLPSVLIPYPYAIYDHQRFNALSVARRGAAQIIHNCEATGLR